MNEDKKYQGSCLCGAIKYALNEFSSEIGHCHCTMCRKFSGAAFSTFAAVPRQSFRWLSGEQDLKSYVADNKSTRQFCRHCGSSMTFASPKEQDDVIEIALGTLHTPLDDILPNAHIYYHYKADWYTPKDALNKHPEYRDSKPL